mmetsp:Transcript_103/g.150  ORF Transcript_103/g.150 Transcript_103/m.150 type:complete len:168 (+) Transcript_103:103-606(+)|eukprot:CAMPEP_0202453078 /NCGR_PEP_ID=MMETSP1360-20130828/11138_1 /ASSEMBLY_ACC=CAM_ASM_000848 /TAXON_ID=515479 /ORGANISM="Licmophora paradoxa, Strain CCMP2313" /LENGTH=167 /DNA_ID=CAMNT_0049072071 /DNA_START=103 /DNA_END=606 /DNA_ORIENTATION=-
MSSKNQLELFLPVHESLSNKTNFIEDDDSSESAESDRLSQEEQRLHEAKQAWENIGGATRKVGRFLIHRELEALKRKAEEVTERYAHQQTEQSSRNKRRKVSHPLNSQESEEIKLLQKEGLVRRMERMRRLKAVFQTLNDAHFLLAQEMQGMIEEASQQDEHELEEE